MVKVIDENLISKFTEPVKFSFLAAKVIFQRSQPLGEFVMYNQKSLLFVAVVFSMVSIANAIDVFDDPNLWPDFNSDNIVNFVDFATFAVHW